MTKEERDEWLEAAKEWCFIGERKGDSARIFADGAMWRCLLRWASQEDF